MKKEKTIEINEEELLSDLIYEEKEEIIKMTKNSFFGVIVITLILIIVLAVLGAYTWVRAVAQIVVLTGGIMILKITNDFKKLQIKMLERYNKIKHENNNIGRYY